MFIVSVLLYNIITIVFQFCDGAGHCLLQERKIRYLQTRHMIPERYLTSLMQMVPMQSFLSDIEQQDRSVKLEKRIGRGSITMAEDE